MWTSAAPVGAVVEGQFIVTSEWYDGDPYSGGGLIGLADDAKAFYEATVEAGSVPVPEAPMWALLLLGLVMVTGTAALTRHS